MGRKTGDWRYIMSVTSASGTHWETKSEWFWRLNPKGKPTKIISQDYAYGGGWREDEISLGDLADHYESLKRSQEDPDDDLDIFISDDLEEFFKR